jgi:hypothetical protein
MANPAIIDALRSLTDNGILHPEAVIDAARDPESPLHDQFTWDETEAARQYNLIEARKLIQVHVEFLTPTSDPSPVFVSLRSDRPKGGGYRKMVDVLSKKALREQLLEDALADLEHFRQKYHMIKELAGVFEAAKAVKRKAG